MVGSPFGTLALVVNPRAGRGRVRLLLPALRTALEELGLDHRVELTRGPWHAAELARQAVREGHRLVVAVGGDGTVHEVVNGLMEAGSAEPPVLGVIQAGTGGDFCRTLGIPHEVPRAVRLLAGEGTHPLDLGRVRFQTPAGPQTRWFANVAEAGYGGEVVARAARLPRRLGRLVYLLAAWATLGAFRGYSVEIRADGRSYRGKMNNTVVANAQFFGGGMRVAPRASPFDGLLDLQIWHGRKLDVFTKVPKIYRGEHVPDPGILELRVSRVEILSEERVVVEADGEVLGTAPASFEVVPGALRLKL